MPLYKTLTVSDSTKVLLWKVTESEDELSKGISLTPNCQNRMLDMKSEMHRRAFLSIRHLLGLQGYEDKNLIYNEFGKPHLDDGNHISISHSHNFTGIIISSSLQVGIDIEKQRDKILRIAHKFTPLQEYRTIANTEALIQKLTQVWCAKESLYKIYATPGLSFLNHIIVNDFAMEDLRTSANIIYKGEKSNYAVSFDNFEGFSFAYAIKES
ncbi:4'-phosphopantetheinyl transferase family protein [Croceivirga thetidis]|uniref:4'-phosphopantetheinyl transferase superfamily protein n=1 Tax=Croceivirga thetidis TaxID=2721623 RepID=A0ABX1GNP0_9FLAO|nr:4'-phosphopantetheinyl transferase family protein [Croceivirga thetidis]NKI31535.1 4'-phosphopantetheinyl transferase superfamily protein [Croceivirga thetidis]